MDDKELLKGKLREALKAYESTKSHGNARAVSLASEKLRRFYGDEEVTEVYRVRRLP